MPTAHSTFLLRLADTVAGAYVDHAGADAVLVAGSTATGTADEWSDIDLVLFYDERPGADRLDAARAALAPAGARALGGDPASDRYLEQFEVHGVACQLVHQTVDAWRAMARSILEELDTASPAQKALAGLHEGAVLYGSALVAELRDASRYPPALREQMVRANLGIFPLWYLQDGLARRDAELWQRSELVAGLQKILAMLAGVNEVWFTTFQLKHMHAMTDAFGLAPPALGARVDAALTAPMPVAAAELERLVDETLSIVARELPEVDVSLLHGLVGRRLDPWRLPDDLEGTAPPPADD